MAAVLPDGGVPLGLRSPTFVFFHNRLTDAGTSTHARRIKCVLGRNEKRGGDKRKCDLYEGFGGCWPSQPWYLQCQANRANSRAASLWGRRRRHPWLLRCTTRSIGG